MTTPDPTLSLLTSAARDDPAARGPTLREQADAHRATKGPRDRRARELFHRADARVHEYRRRVDAAKAKSRALSKRAAGLDADDQLRKIGLKFHRAIKRRDAIDRKFI